MSKGNVPAAIGTGVRQFSGIFSVTDVVGNNLLAISATSIVIGNVPDSPNVVVLGPTFLEEQVVVTSPIAAPTIFQDTGNPAFLLSATTNSPDQKNTIIRMGGAPTGTFAISAATDAAPSVAANNLLSATRSGAAFTALTFGGAFPITYQFVSQSGLVFNLDDNTQGPNGKIWRLQLNGGAFSIAPDFDAGGQTHTSLAIGRNGASTTAFIFGNNSDNPTYQFLGTGGIGFFSATAAPKQSVTGAKGGNAALTSLLAALATFGLITDSTS